MKICLPTMNEDGLEAVISGHFGQAPFFTFVDTDSGEVTCEPNSGQHQGGPGQVTPAQLIASKGASTVICGGLGPRAVELLTGQGIQIFAGAEGTVQQALDAHGAGQLQEATADGACPDGEPCH